MQNEEAEFQQEKTYLAQILTMVEQRLCSGREEAITEKKKLVELSRQMYNNTVHFSSDFDKLIEANQALGDVEMRARSYERMTNELLRYEKMVQTPYFARIDFQEDDFEREKIYIGRAGLTGDDGLEVCVYDWRAPISSLFYQCEPGRVSYQSPSGKICGDMNKKRQYEIKNGQLKGFFDCSINIMDDVLRQVLAKNASPHMQSIVETIQREQDLIIRDMDSDLLMVQGAAGSGKTSVALHRVAFLMYQGLESHLTADNIIILSPNQLFGRYIAGVLPELGEENIRTLTFEDIFDSYFEGSPQIVSRNATLEQMLCGTEEARLLKAALHFQLSESFQKILDALAECYAREILEIPDVVYAGNCIATSGQLQAELLATRVNMPLQKRLRVLEEGLLEQVHRAKPVRLAKLREEVLEQTEHQFEVKAQARLLSIKEITALAHKIRTFTRLDVRGLYRRLFSDKKLFAALSQGVPLPENCNEILCFLEKGQGADCIRYADGMALLYLRLRLEGAKPAASIRQVVVDEAQDYDPLHFAMLHEMMPTARYTILGDVNQTVEKGANLTLYEDIRRVLQKRRSTLAVMNKTFRCSSEIQAFSRRFLEVEVPLQSFERHEAPPKVRVKETQQQTDAALLEDLCACRAQGFASIAVLCKTFASAQALYNRIKEKTEVHLVGDGTTQIGMGVYLLPIYLAKGLEFDAALVYGAQRDVYCTQDDKRLLYVASTRPLHRLFFYSTGAPTAFLGDVPFDD